VTNEVNIPSLESSLLAYKLQVNAPSCERQLLKPMLRQSISEPYESKFFVNVHDVDLNLHGLAPYLVPQIRRGGGVPSKGVTLQFWTDPICDGPLDIAIKFDLLGSLGKTVIRYRIALAAFPLAIIALCLRRQFSEYNSGGIVLPDVTNLGYFLSFDDALLLVIRDHLPMLLLCVSVASIWISSTQSPEESPFTVINSKALEALGFSGNSTSHARKNDLLLGLREPFLWFLTPLFVIMCVGITVVVSKVAFLITVAFTALWNRFPLFPWVSAVQWLDRSAPFVGHLFRKSGSWLGTD
jgi:GPI inositol-deacylase